MPTERYRALGGWRGARCCCGVMHLLEQVVLAAAPAPSAGQESTAALPVQRERAACLAVGLR